MLNFIKHLGQLRFAFLGKIVLRIIEMGLLAYIVVWIVVACIMQFLIDMPKKGTLIVSALLVWFFLF